MGDTDDSVKVIEAAIERLERQIEALRNQQEGMRLAIKILRTEPPS